MNENDFRGRRVIEDLSEWIMKGPAGSICIPRDGRWKFDGNYERPTFTPSLNEAVGKPGQAHEDMAKTGPAYRSHLFITAGRVKYLADCTHEYAGTEHELAEVNPIRAYCAWLRCHPEEPK